MNVAEDKRLTQLCTRKRTHTRACAVAVVTKSLPHRQENIQPWSLYVSISTSFPLTCRTRLSPQAVAE